MSKSRFLVFARTGNDIQSLWHFRCEIIPNRGRSSVARKAGAIDRRRYQRIPLAIPVFVRGMDGDQTEFLEFATALNWSANGALLAIRRYLPRSSKVSLEIPSAPLPNKAVLPRAIRRMRARLLRVTALNGCHLWALKFTTSLLPKSIKRTEIAFRQVK